MSTAHRPTWTPAQAKATSTSSRQYSSRDMAAQTKLKFRQPGQSTKDETSRRDLRLELERAEKRAKSKAQGKTNEEIEKEAAQEAQDDEEQQAAKRRKLMIEAVALDKDDVDSEPEQDSNANTEKHGRGEDQEDKDKDDQEEDQEEEEEEEEEEADSDEDDSEDETADLLRELEKIKRERAEEKERQDREAAQSSEAEREASVAMGNPLLNLQAAMSGAGNATPGSMTAPSTTSSGFGVKRRWDDDVIFKNQAADEKPKKEFVNDLLRTEFHKKFLKRFIA